MSGNDRLNESKFDKWFVTEMFEAFDDDIKTIMKESKNDVTGVTEGLSNEEKVRKIYNAIKQGSLFPVIDNAAKSLVVKSISSKPISQRIQEDGVIKSMNEDSDEEKIEDDVDDGDEEDDNEDEDDESEDEDIEMEVETNNNNNKEEEESEEDDSSSSSSGSDSSSEEESEDEKRKKQKR